MKTLATNKFAHSSYNILDKIEAGIALLGSEVKSIKAGSINLKEGHIKIEHGEAWLIGVHISPYQPKQNQNYSPTRPRKLLLNKAELNKLYGKLQEQGLSVIPLSVYLKNNLIKLEIGIGRGLKKYDRRAKLKLRETTRTIQRKLRRAN